MIYYSHRSLDLELDELRFNPCFIMVTWYLVKIIGLFWVSVFSLVKMGMTGLPHRGLVSIKELSI